MICSQSNVCGVAGSTIKLLESSKSVVDDRIPVSCCDPADRLNRLQELSNANVGVWQSITWKAFLDQR